MISRLARTQMSVCLCVCLSMCLSVCSQILSMPLRHNNARLSHETVQVRS